MNAKYINPYTDFGFKKVFEKAELASLGQADRDKYESSLKIYRDLKGVIDTAFDEGKAEGKAEGKMAGKIETAKMMKAEGEPVEKIVRYTGLSEGEISKL